MIKRILLLLGTLLLCSCPETVPPRVPTTGVSPTAITPSPAPTLGTAIDLHGKADGQAAITASQVKTLSGQLEAVHREAQSAVAELARLRASKFAVETDLVSFYNRLVEQEKQVKLMTLQVVEVEQSLLTERQLREQASSKLRETDALLRAKESEAQVLRSQLEQANLNALNAEAAVKASGTALTRALDNVSRLTGESAFKTKLLIGAAALTVLLLLFILLLLKFRTILPF